MLKNILFLGILLFAFQAFSASEQQKKMVKMIDSIASVYDAMYAPALWKKEFSNWTLAETVKTAKTKILAKEPTLSEFHKITNELILSMKDYHVSANYYATESASLPFTVRGAEGRYFFAYIDRDKLPKAEFPFEIGDELLSFDNVSVASLVKELVGTMGGNTKETDQALAELNLTRRRAARAQDVPQGPVTITIKTQAGKTVDHQLIWDYKKEQVLPSLVKNNTSLGLKLPKLDMTSQVALDLMQEMNAANPFALGGKKSYLPALGTKIWSSDKENHFDAYIYLSEKKELIGYVRIPKYGAGEKEAKQFEAIIKKFQKTTDKLVIDQLNNPGGSVFYLYSLVSMLTDKAMFTPKHYMAINQEMIMDDIKTLKDLDKIKNLEELKKAFGSETVGGYPLTMTFLSFMKSYYQFKIDEWNAGKKLTSPYHLYGVDKINPHPEAQYTKPILLLVNELDFSGGDFFPAIMQDNKRATIMGVRTAGAGGYVIGVSIPNQLGVGGFRYTGSLADRVDNTPIENLGVKPEVDYTLTVKDFQNKFAPFAKAIKAQINQM